MRTPLLSAVVAGLLLAGCGTTPPVATPVAPTTSATTPVESVTPSATPTTASPTPSETPSATPDAASLVLRGDGLATFDFGAKQAPVSELLSDQLGAPDETHQGLGCELDSETTWTQTQLYGGLWVQFSAKDKHKSSPRFLSAWGFTLAEDFAAPLAMEDDVPLNLSFKELQAKYPGAKLEDLGLGDGSKLLTLPNKIMFVGAKAPMTVQGGEFGTCE